MLVNILKFVLVAGGNLMNKAIKILMKRDKMSYDEAQDLIKMCQTALKSGKKDAILDYLDLDDSYRRDVLSLK